jgi:DNA-binding transcriptional ArsR family regulator
VTARKRTSAERILAALPPPGEPLAVEAITARTRLSRKEALRDLARLRTQGLVENTGGPGHPGAYRLTRAGVEARAAGGVSKPGPKGAQTGRRQAPVDTLRARVWRALRANGKATIPELLISASRGDERAAASNIGRYLRALERAGYVTRLKRRSPGTKITSNGFITWLLLPDRDTGARAPAHHPVRGELRDPNTGEVHHV